MDPGWTIIFYGGWSLGEGLSLGESQNAMFTLLGGISWVGKQAQLNTNELSLWEGWQLIVQAITEWCIEGRGPGCPIHICLHYHHLGFAIRMGPHRKRGSRMPTNAWRSLDVPIRHHTMMRLAITMQLRLQQEAAWPMGCTDPNTFTFTVSWVWEQQKFSINFLISVIMVS